MRYPTPPEVTFVKLPSKKVVTYDGVRIKRGDHIFFRLAPGPKPSEYVVVGDHMVQFAKFKRIIVVGGGYVIAGMNPLDFVVDVDHWRAFYNARHAVP